MSIKISSMSYMKWKSVTLPVVSVEFELVSIFVLFIFINWSKVDFSESLRAGGGARAPQPPVSKGLHIQIKNQNFRITNLSIKIPKWCQLAFPSRCLLYQDTFIRAIILN